MQVISEPDSRRLLLPQKSSNLFAAAILFFLFFPSILLAANDPNYHKLNQNKFFSSENKYQPYVEIGGVKYFSRNSTVAGIYDLFIPLLQKEDQLLFTDLRFFDRSGSSFEGNAHLGYRKLYSDTEQMFGIYGAFDRRKTAERNFFNQLTFGFEYWQNKFFVGGNIYKPIGVTQKLQPSTLQIRIDPKFNFSEITLTETQITKQGTEKSLPGVDLELGYAITDNLTGYAGGYYFAAHNTKTVVGPRARFTYDYTKPTGRILGILDGISIEAGVQHDKPRNTAAYIGIKFKIGLTNLKRTSNIQGFARHMVEPVRRDPDIVYQPTEMPYVTINIGPNIPINAQHLIGHFGITKDTPPQELAKIYVYLVDYLVSHLGIVDKAIETGTYYLNLLYEAGSMLISSVSDACRNYQDELRTPNGWWESKPRLEKFLGDKEFSKLPPVSQEIAQKDHVEKIITTLGLTDEKDVNKLFRQATLTHHPDKGGKAENFYKVNNRKDDLIKVLTSDYGKPVSKPDSNYYETPVGTDIPTKDDDATDTTNPSKQPVSASTALVLLPYSELKKQAQSEPAPQKLQELLGKFGLSPDASWSEVRAQYKKSVRIYSKGDSEQYSDILELYTKIADMMGHGKGDKTLWIDAKFYADAAYTNSLFEQPISTSEYDTALVPFKPLSFLKDTPVRLSSTVINSPYGLNKPRASLPSDPSTALAIHEHPGFLKGAFGSITKRNYETIQFDTLSLQPYNDYWIWTQFWLGATVYNYYSSIQKQHIFPIPPANAPPIISEGNCSTATGACISDIPITKPNIISSEQPHTNGIAQQNDEAIQFNAFILWTQSNIAPKNGSCTDDMLCYIPDNSLQPPTEIKFDLIHLLMNEKVMENLKNVPLSSELISGTKPYIKQNTNLVIYNPVDQIIETIVSILPTSSQMRATIDSCGAGFLSGVYKAVTKDNTKKPFSNLQPKVLFNKKFNLGNNAADLLAPIATTVFNSNFNIKTDKLDGFWNKYLYNTLPNTVGKSTGASLVYGLNGKSTKIGPTFVSDAVTYLGVVPAYDGVVYYSGFDDNGMGVQAAKSGVTAISKTGLMYWMCRDLSAGDMAITVLGEIIAPVLGRIESFTVANITVNPKKITDNILTAYQAEQIITVFPLAMSAALSLTSKLLTWCSHHKNTYTTVTTTFFAFVVVISQLVL